VPIASRRATLPCPRPHRRSRRRRDRVQSRTVSPGGHVSRQIDLLHARRFMPLFAVQTTSSVADNLFKSAFIMLVTFGATMGGATMGGATMGGATMRTGLDPGVLSAIAGGVLIAPYFLFSALAGELADRYERSRLLRVLKGAELATVVIAAAALLVGDIVLSFIVLFLLGVQVTMSSPVRYALLPQHLRPDELVDGNALLAGGTFLAILFGTIAGGIASGFDHGVAVVCVLLIACAALGFGASLLVPRAPAPAPELHLTRNPIVATGAILRHAWEQRAVKLAILGASWFWLVGSVFLSQIPVFAKETLGVGTGVVTLFLAAFSIGIGIGSVLCGRLMGGEVSARYVPWAAAGMALFSLDLAAASLKAVPPGDGELHGVVAFLSSVGGMRIFADLTLIAICGGLYIVPLNAIIQHRSDEAARARTIAAMNIMNALFMTAAAAVTALLLWAGLTAPHLWLILGLLNAAVALWICRLLPQDVLRLLARLVLRLLYRVELRGAEHLAAAGERVVIVPNHVSYLDGPLIAAFLPGDPMFAIDTGQAAKWWVRPLLAGADIYPMDPLRPMATKSLIHAIRANRQCVIFPEGRLNVTGGALMKVYDGPALIADKGDAPVLPVRIDGVEFTPFSRLARHGGRLRRHWFPKVTITLYPPRRLDIPAQLRGRTRRRRAGLMLYDAMSEMMARRPDPPSLFGALLAARAAHGGRRPIMADPTGGPLSYNRLVAASLVLGRRLAQRTARGEAVGMLLPNSIGAGVGFLALQAIGRVPAMLNHTAGVDAVLSACRTAELRFVITSRRFVELARLDAMAAALTEAVAIVWLEDLRAGLGPLDRLYGLVAPRIAAAQHRRLGIAAAEPAAILFTSGSEGAPKGVVLSHANLLANRRQLAARIDYSPADHLLSPLPMFHSFGLTGGFLLPILSGVRVFLYPSPLHYRIIPELAYDLGATILFGTDTFLTGYARAANPYDFYALRYVFAGAEPVREETRRIWAERFGKRILEGYGVTECSPVIAINTPMHFKAGTVGRLLPLMEHRLEPFPEPAPAAAGARASDVAERGLLLLAGPNVMSGYLRSDRPGIVQPPQEGWHDTGDIVHIDAEGFVTIVGRAKRFAKLAGEMVSLAVAERIASAAYPEARHAVVALPDERRGERLVLVSEAPAVRRDALIEAAQRERLPELAIPRDIIAGTRLPLLGSGKTDYPAVTRLAVAATSGADETARRAAG
jgi:acyl-[acyl-carrier-protein]-phospholipid O-acyltransferase/long-chain-fatty-acid--[acyl-carrier-protein] ligase